MRVVFTEYETILYDGGAFIIELRGEIVVDFILTKKQRKVLETIDRFGVITNIQLEKILAKDVSRATIFRVRNKLEEMGFVEERQFGRRSVVSITKKGSEYIGEINTGGGTSYANLQHDLTANETIYRLTKMYTEKGQTVSFSTVRELKRSIVVDLSLSERKQANKLRYISEEIPDFQLNLSGKELAFEIELSRKTNHRIEKKVRQYQQSLSDGRYDAVFYICKDEGIKKHIEKIAAAKGVSFQYLLLNQIVDSEEI